MEILRERQENQASAADLDVVPVRGHRLYGQYGQNQFQTSFELNTYPEALKAAYIMLMPIIMRQ